MRHPSRPSLLLPAVVGALVLGLTGCASSEQSSSPAPVPAPTSASPAPTSGGAGGSTSAGGAQYVALGDSYSAAPGLPTQDPSAGSCARSLSNYPHLVAQARPGLVLDDQTCSGAKTSDVTADQLGDLSAATRYVSVGIGGNDDNLFSLVVGACTQLASQDPTGSPCTDAVGSALGQALVQIETNVAGLLAEVKQKAPNAQIVVVGYPQVLPSDGTTCTDRIPIAAGDYPLVNTMNKGLSTDLESAAKTVGADFVDVYAASAGHSICADKPWVNGAQTASNGVIPFHPFLVEQQAVARLVTQTMS